MDEVTTPNTPKGFGRFAKHIILGGVFGGVLSAIPILSCINCLFCLLNIAGIVFALSLYLKANPSDMLTNGESAGFGAAAGAVAGLIAGIANLLIQPLFSGAMSSLLASIPGMDSIPGADSSGMNMFGALGAAIQIPVNIIVYAAFGALGAFLGMMFFFKKRINKA